MPKRKRPASSRRRSRRGRLRRIRLKRVAASLAVVGVALSALLLYLVVEISDRFESRLWTAPATVYSAALEAPRGAGIEPDVLVRRLERCGYARVRSRPERPGQYRLTADGLEVRLRAFSAPRGTLESRFRALRFRRGRLQSIRDATGQPHPAVVLEPEVLAVLHDTRREEREVLPYDAFPESFVRAVLAAEDARFFDHSGVDLRAVVRAVLVNLRSRRVVQGGSTISQQTVKNLYLGHQRTWWRKIREIPMALLLDLRYPKERILEVYLNEVYLGQRGSVAICGAEAAARFYFGRGLSDLTLGEHAALAGMIRSPGSYNPFRHPERTAERRNQVLEAMVRRGWADRQEAARARSEPLVLGSGEGGFSRARYVVDAVRADLDAHYPQALIREGGLRVYTTLDTALQERAEAALSRGLERLERDAPAVRRNLEARRLQGAVVVTRPEDGAILALVGGRDYADTQFNRALHARRQPGSCFKPFVYLAGFERAGGPHGLTPATELQDRPLELVSGGRTWRPSNHDGTFRGSVTAREALQDSINVATVRAATRVGLDAVIETAAACGIETPLRALPSLALGAQEVTPVELAAAYGTLASGGVRADLWIIAEIRDRDGGRLDRPERSIRRVIDEAPVFLVNDVLRGVLETGTARRARTLGYGGPAAGKTGTSDDARDAWFVGYTPELLALVWVGYDDNARIGVGGSSAALPIWVDLMAGSEAFGSGRGFRRPPGVVRRRVDPETGYLAVPGCPRSVSDWYPIEAAPDTRCPTHRRRGFRNWFRRLIGRDEEV